MTKSFSKLISYPSLSTLFLAACGSGRTEHSTTAGFGLGGPPSPTGHNFVIDRRTRNDCQDDISTWQVSLQLYDAKAQPIGSPAVDTYRGGALVSWSSDTVYQIREDKRTGVSTRRSFEI